MLAVAKNQQSVVEKWRASLAQYSVASSPRQDCDPQVEPTLENETKRPLCLQWNQNRQ